jgi:hypothetical protein
MEELLLKKAQRFFLAVAAICLPAAATPSHAIRQSSTVNSYTPAQEADARQAAIRAGLTPGPVLFAQAGNFFFNATKSGQSYGLTVTPDGQVYSTTPTK